MSQREQVSQLNKTETDVKPHIVTVGKRQHQTQLVTRG